MVTCVVTGCRSGYKPKKGEKNEQQSGKKEKEKIHWHTFPDDKNKLAVWKAKIPRKDFKVTIHTRICHKHFLLSDYESERTDTNAGRKSQKGSLRRWKLKPDAIPSVWRDLPRHLTKTPPTPRPTSLATFDARQLNVQAAEERREHEDRLKDTFSSLTELKKRILEVKDLPANFINEENKQLLLAAIKYTDKPEVIFCLIVSENFDYELWSAGRKIRKDTVRLDEETPWLPDSLTSIKLVLKILRYLEETITHERARDSRDSLKEAIEILENSEFSEDTKISFIIEQLSLVSSKPTARRYSSSYFAFSIMLHKISPAAYNHIHRENILTLPSVRRLKQLTMALDHEMKLGEAAQNYLKARISKLSLRDTVVTLIIDEVHTRKQVEYVGGKFYGMENGKITSTLLCLMIRSVAGRYRDLISMQPVSNLNSSLQKDVWFKNIKILEQLGFDVVVTLTDGNNVNHKFFKDILMSKTLKVSLQNPFNESRLIFLGFDTVHLFKCFYTNFVNRKLFSFPKFDERHVFLEARFDDIKELYEMERGAPLRKAYKLSDKVLSPTNIERSNVMLANNLFHESTIHSLQYYGNKGNESFLHTATYLQIIRKWFNTLNVKSRYESQWSRDQGREVIRKENRDTVLGYLHSFSTWLTAWEEQGEKGLSEQTFTAARQTTNMFQGLVNYLLDEKEFSYVIPRNVQSDPLEGRFGWLRQLNGGDYFNSVTQFVQAEKTIRIRSLVQMGFNMSDMKDIFQVSVTQEKVEIDLQIDGMVDAAADIEVETEIGNMSPDQRSTVCYIAGSISRSLMKKLPFDQKHCCSSLITQGKSMTLTNDRFSVDSIQNIDDEEFLNLVSRGGLQHPSDCVFVTTCHAYQFYEKIKENETLNNLLLDSSNPREMFVNVFEKKLSESNNAYQLMDAKCESGHSFLPLILKITRGLFNIMAKNIIAYKNDDIHYSKKRKGNDPKLSSAARKILKLNSSS